jgi:hypothetical protein
MSLDERYALPMGTTSISGAIQKTRTPSGFHRTGFINSGNVLLSRNLEMHYHWGCSVSLPCSEWERVAPLRYDHQKAGEAEVSPRGEIGGGLTSTSPENLETGRDALRRVRCERIHFAPDARERVPTKIFIQRTKCSLKSA